MLKELGARSKSGLDPMILLDYRCYVKGGALGTNYPPELTPCLTKVSDPLLGGRWGQYKRLVSLPVYMAQERRMNGALHGWNDVHCMDRITCAAWRE